MARVCAEWLWHPGDSVAPPSLSAAAGQPRCRRVAGLLCGRGQIGALVRGFTKVS